MSNGNQNLDDYFPAGSTATDAIKRKVSNSFQGNVIQTNTPVLTLADLKTILDEKDKKSNRQFWMGIVVTVILALIGIIVSIIVI